MEAEIEEEGRYIDPTLFNLIVQVLEIEIGLGATIEYPEEFALAIYDELSVKAFGRFPLTA